MPEAEGAPVGPPPGAERANIAYFGLSGALLGAAIFAVVAVIALADPGDRTRSWALFYAAVSLGFLPAAAFSILPSPRRDLVLRATTAACMALVFVGLFALGDIGFPIILAPPTVLLATGAGLIFQGPRRR